MLCTVTASGNSLVTHICKGGKVVCKQAADRHTSTHPIKARLLLLMHTKKITALPHIIVLQPSSS